MLNLWVEVILNSKIHALFVLQLPSRKNMFIKSAIK